jgi:hypothetical protein
MKIAAIVLFALAEGVAFAAYPQTLQAWNDGNWSVSKIRDQQYLEYSDDQLSELLPAIAKWIPIQNELEDHPDKSWRAFKSEQDWTPFLNALRLDHPIRKKWGMGHQAAWVIRVLSEKRRVYQENLLPILIDGVAHPSSSFTGRDCFCALKALTKLYDGPLTSWGDFEYPDEAQLISKWFSSWRTANLGKKLITTKERENKIKKDYLMLCSRLEELTLDSSHSLHGFKSPTEEDYHRVGEPLFGVQWDGRFRSSILGDLHGEGWVWVMVRPQTKLIEGIKRWEKYPSWDTLEVLPSEARKIYSSAFVDSDWSIEVYVHRVKDEEIESLSAGLKKKAEKGGGGQPATRPESKRPS